MILNAYAVLALFVALVEFALGVVVVFVGARALRLDRRGRAPDGSALHGASVVPEREARLSSLFLLAFTLLGTSVASWPLLYLLLQSYVPEWEGVMCIQGVTRVGTDSEGAAGFLPALVRTLELSKPALVFATGAWLVVHLADRRTRTSPLAGRELVLLVVVGAIAVGDASAELAYVAIPKKERFLAQGCCTTPTAAMLAGRPPDRSAPFGLPGTRRGWIVGGFYAIAGALVLGARALASADRGERGRVDGRSPPGEAALPPTCDDAPERPGPPRSPRGFAWLGVGVAASVPIAALFLSDVAAPAFLHRPEHRCAYCLLSDTPWGAVTAALLATGVFSTGWAVVAQALAHTPETTATLPPQRARLLRTGALGYVGALVVVTIGLVLA